MSQPLRNPTFIAGTPRSSGGVQDGSISHVRAGDRAASYLSGVNLDTVIYSGAGRLNSVLQLNSLTSGRGVLFYDGVPIATSGGPFATSGHKVIGLIPPAWNMAASGVATPFTGEPLRPEMPFQSGLLVAPFQGSGVQGFSLSFTPEVSQSFPGV